MIIEKDIQKIKLTAGIGSEENEKLLETLKSGIFDSESIDSFVKQIFAEMKSEIDCRKCGQCCKDVLVVFEETDMARLSEGLNEERQTVEKKYFQKYEKFKCFVMNQSPCHFQKENLCTIYEYRGTECREFPYLDTRCFSEIYKYVFQGYSICPFHFNVIEAIKTLPEFKIKKEVNFGT
ncbi:MAG: YkgJ family cysteine cluster protein [bacterium]